jgi:hypothetical protein
MVVKMSVLLSWIVTPHGFVGRYHCFSEVFLHTSLYGITLQKNSISIQSLDLEIFLFINTCACEDCYYCFLI